MKKVQILLKSVKNTGHFFFEDLSKFLFLTAGGNIL